MDERRQLRDERFQMAVQSTMTIQELRRQLAERDAEIERLRREMDEREKAS